MGHHASDPTVRVEGATPAPICKGGLSGQVLRLQSLSVGHRAAQDDRVPSARGYPRRVGDYELDQAGGWHGRRHARNQSRRPGPAHP